MTLKICGKWRTAIFSSPPVQLSSIIDFAFRWVSGVGDDVPQFPNFLKVFQESVRENVVGWYKIKPLLTAFLVPGACQPSQNQAGSPI